MVSIAYKEDNEIGLRLHRDAVINTSNELLIETGIKREPAEIAVDIGIQYQTDTKFIAISTNLALNIGLCEHVAVGGVLRCCRSRKSYLCLTHYQWAACGQM